jgi:hypothetical protein
MHAVTRKWLKTKPVSLKQIARLIDCTEGHAEAVLSGAVEPTAREQAIIRLCVNVRNDHLLSILGEMGRDYEWRTVPGYSRYEVSEQGQLRRIDTKRVLRPKIGRGGYHYVNLTPDDRSVPQRQIGIHRAVCLAFWGPQPSLGHVVCHRNDTATDNRPDNLYWGTAFENAADKKRNLLTRSGPPVHHSHLERLGATHREVRNYVKKSRHYRLSKIAKNA